MERKIYSSIILASLVTVVAGCARFADTPKQKHMQHYQLNAKNQMRKVLPSEPAPVLQPFSFKARTWFDTDSAQLKPQGMRILDQLAVQLTRAKAKGLVTEKNKVVIFGHTDSRASNRYNMALSDRRAAAVAKYLTSKGIPSEAMLAIPRGEFVPVASNRTAAGRQENRRVEVYIDGAAVRVVSN